MTSDQTVDPRTTSGRLTLRYRGVPTTHLLSLLHLGLDDTDRPHYTRNELISMLVDRDLTNKLRQAFRRLEEETYSS